MATASSEREYAMGESEIAGERAGRWDNGLGASRETEAFVWKVRRGAIVIVHGVATLDLVRKLLYDLRGSEFAITVRCRCCYRENDVRGALAGQNRPVDIHPAFYRLANEDAAKLAETLAEAANSRFAKKTDCRT